MRRAIKAGISKTIIFAPFHTNYAQANEEVARIIARYPDRLIGFAFVHPFRDAGHIFDLVRHAIIRWRFCGIKVHGLDAMPTREVCEAAKAFRVPILADVVGQAHVVDMLAPEYPDVNFIIAHLGSFSDDWRAHQRVIDQLVRFDNVYTDTAGVRRFDYIVQAIKRAGPHKVLFGSDGPWLHPSVELHKIKVLNLPVKDEALVLGENAYRLLRHVKVGNNAAQSHQRYFLHHDRSRYLPPLASSGGRLSHSSEPDYPL